MKSRVGRTIVVACTNRRAEVFCRRLGFSTREPGVYVVTGREHLRGDRRRPDDRLILIGGGFEERVAEQLQATMHVADFDLYDAEWIDG